LDDRSIINNPSSIINDYIILSILLTLILWLIHCFFRR